MRSPTSGFSAAGAHDPSPIDHAFEDRLARVVRDVPRDVFISSEHELPIPQRLAHRLLTALAPHPEDTLLHVGTGRGYATALCSRVTQVVYSVDKIAPVIARARSAIAQLGYDNIHFRTSSGEHGLPRYAPYDCILVTARGVGATTSLKQQLRVGGRMVVCHGDSRHRPRLTKIERIDDTRFSTADLGAIQFHSTLADTLVEMGLLSSEQCAQLVAKTDNTDDNLDAELLQNAGISESEFFSALGRQHGLRLTNIDAVPAVSDRTLLGQLSREFLHHNRVLPLTRDEQSAILVTCNPTPDLGGVAGALGVERLDLRLVTATDFHRLWAQSELLRARQASEGMKGATAVELVAGGNDEDATRSVQLFRALMLEAVGSRASDIHVEQFEDRVQVRLRIDGELQTLNRVQLNTNDCAALVNVIKVRAKLDIAEKRHPQGGRIELRIHAKHYDLRVQVQPCLHGEHVVLRILARDAVRPDITELGFPAPISNGFQRMLRSPGGMLLVVGPTGSGKTTTLYAGLGALSRDQTRKVISIEDPVEYSMSGIQQTEVRPEIGFTFSDAMRSFVRQDPDVILVGEIRDSETALEAIRASQTGHLVLSTLHCNDSLDAVQRLRDLDMHSSSIACELLGVVAQRLAKRICNHCREPAKVEDWLLDELFAGVPPKTFQSFVGRGCAHCDGRGTYGRVAVGEFLRVTPELRRAIVSDATPDDLREMAHHSGLITMRDSALGLVSEGVIALDELPRILTQEGLMPPMHNRYGPNPMRTPYNSAQLASRSGRFSRVSHASAQGTGSKSVTSATISSKSSK